MPISVHPKQSSDINFMTYVHSLSTGRYGGNSGAQASRAGIASSVSGWIKPISYKVDTDAQALLGQGKDWLAQCQDNVTEWGIG